MKAVVIHKFGGNEEIFIEEMPMPLPGPDDVLIKVRSASVNPIDWKIRNGSARLLTRSKFPIILGRECAGEVVETGKRVTKYSKGAQVICVPDIRHGGAFAEYACAPVHAVFPKSVAATFEQAASIPIAGLTALQALRDKGRIAAGRRVLINGASGGVGHFAVQIAKIYGADVTGVSSGANADFVKRLGADHVIDYAQQDFTAGTIRYDLVFDAVAKRSFGEIKKVLTSKGIYVSTLPSAGIIINQFMTGHFTRKRASLIMVRTNEADMEWMNRQISAGKIKIFIDKKYPLEQAKEALAYSESGKVKGKIALLPLES